MLTEPKVLCERRAEVRNAYLHPGRLKQWGAGHKLTSPPPVVGICWYFLLVADEIFHVSCKNKSDAIAHGG